LHKSIGVFCAEGRIGGVSITETGKRRGNPGWRGESWKGNVKKDKHRRARSEG